MPVAQMLFRCFPHVSSQSSRCPGQVTKLMAQSKDLNGTGRNAVHSLSCQTTASLQRPTFLTCSILGSPSSKSAILKTNQLWF